MGKGRVMKKNAFAIAATLIVFAGNVFAENKELLNFDDGVYELNCSLESSDRKFFFDRADSFNIFIQEKTKQLNYSYELPFLQAQMHQTFTVRDGQIASYINEKLSQPQYSSFEFVGLSNDFAFDLTQLKNYNVYNTDLDFFVLRDQTEYSVAQRSLTDEKLKSLPIYTNQPFNGSGGHSDSEIESMRLKEGARFNYFRNTFLTDGGKTHPNYKNKLITNFVGSTYPDIVVDLMTLKAIVRVPAIVNYFEGSGSEGNGGGGGGRGYNPPGSRTLVYKFGSFACNLNKK